MVTETKFQNYLIRSKEDKCIAFHNVFTNRLAKFEGNDCIQKAKNWIRSYFEDRESWDNISETMISFNVDFLREIMGEQDFFSFDMYEEDDSVYIRVYNNVDNGMFKTTGKSNRKKPTLGSEWSGHANKVKCYGLYPNARYSVEEVTPNTFKLIFDSVIEHKNDYYRLGIPGFMVYSTR